MTASFHICYLRWDFVDEFELFIEQTKGKLKEKRINVITKINRIVSDIVKHLPLDFKPP
jgi:hypothetical protein